MIALTAQGLVYSIHSGLVLSRADTRNLARAWVVRNIPAGARIVVEPVVPNAWLNDTGGPGIDHMRWVKYPTLRVVLNPATGVPEPTHRTVLLENYESTLGPALVSYYEREGYCWVVSGYTQSGRAFADPKVVPNAIAYYRELEKQGEVVYHVSPYSSRAEPRGVQLRLDVRLLPARLPPPRPGNDRLPPARWTLRLLISPRDLAQVDRRVIQLRVDPLLQGDLA